MLRLCVLALACLLAISFLPPQPDPTSFVATPPLDQRNKHYVSNRAPLLPNPLVKLPIGAVQPLGWLRKQLELQAAGFHGHLTEISQFLKKDKNAWLSPDGQGERGWEEVPYWLKGFGDTAYLLNNEKQIAEAKVWIEGTIRSQGADGMFGPRGKGAQSTVSSTKGKYDLWSNMVMLHCLQSYYEVTQDKRVIDLMTKYFKWQLSLPEEDLFPPYWQHQRAADNLTSVLWLYNHTGDAFLLDLAHKNHRRTANWTADVPDWHNVNMTQAFGGPAFYYPLSKDKKHLDAAERNWTKIRQTYGNVPGGLFAGDENCRVGFSDPRQAIETCGMVEFMFSCERLLTIAADPRWADRCEDVAYNSLPAALTPDFKALRYLTAPNLVQSDKGNKSPGFENSGPMLQMNPHIHRCCQHNFGHGWPYWAQHLWYATGDNGLAAVFYAPSKVKAKVGDDGTEVTITQKTEYPFEGKVVLTVSAPKPVRFPLYLRKPSWCQSFAAEVRPGDGSDDGWPHHDRPGYLKIDREWRPGDRVTITLVMPIRVQTWKENKNSVSVERGPLTFSLRIGEKYVRSGGTERWPAWDIYPTTAWNYGLVLQPTPPKPPEQPADINSFRAARFRESMTPQSFDIVHKVWPASDLPFTHECSPVVILAKAKKIPEWKTDHLGLVGLLQPSPVKSDEPVETIALIPMGAARLRITAFPVIGEGPTAHTWVVPPEAKPLKVTASHCYANDTPRAVGDGVVPKHSADTTVPRFTWWDHRGTAEWIQWEFDAPRAVQEVQVYWFDDEPKNGGCRTPASWKLLYKKGDAWEPVTNASAFGVAKDQFNRVTFDAVTTPALKIETQLRPAMSAGILEWEVK